MGSIYQEALVSLKVFMLNIRFKVRDTKPGKLKAELDKSIIRDFNIPL